MKRNLIMSSILLSMILCGSHSLFAQTEKAKSLFSHKGIKAALGAGTFEMPSENSVNEGDAGTLSLGYGFSDRSTLWLSLAGAEYPSASASVSQSVLEFGGVEISYQYKFRPQSGLQPYGKVGFGVYGLHQNDSDEVIWGGGVNLALGADYFFSRHFGIGAELIFKDIEFSQRSRENLNGDVITSELVPSLNRDSGGFLITLTIQ